MPKKNLSNGKPASPQNTPTTKENKLVILGAGAVGKTSLIVQYLQGYFSPAYKPTIEDNYRSTIKMPDGVYHTVEILDTAGAHNFPAMRELSIRSGKGFILVFSVDSLQSFLEAKQIWEFITHLRGMKVPIVLVGNKTDLKEQRMVSEEMVDQTIEETMKNCKYIETSAMLNLNVGQIFVELLEQARILDQPPVDPSLKSRRLSRRLSSLGSLHGLTIRRKSSIPRPDLAKLEEIQQQEQKQLENQLEKEQIRNHQHPDPRCTVI